MNLTAGQSLRAGGSTFWPVSPPGWKPNGLEAEPEAESRSWVGEKTSLKMRGIVIAVSIIDERSARR